MKLGLIGQIQPLPLQSLAPSPEVSAPLGIRNVGNSCYGATALHVVASTHDNSLPTVVPAPQCIINNMIGDAVHTVAHGGTLQPEEMNDLMCTVERAAYTRGRQGDSMEFIWKLALLDPALVSTTLILEKHVHSLSCGAVSYTHLTLPTILRV